MKIRINKVTVWLIIPAGAVVIYACMWVLYGLEYLIAMIGG
jgi:hypothetical protein